MKTKLLVLIGAYGLLSAGLAQAANLTWDPAGGGSSDGAGTWLSAGKWWNGAANVDWNNLTPDDATIGNGGSGGTITLGTVTAGTVLFDNFTGTYTLTGDGGTLSQSGGITIGAGAGSVRFNGHLNFSIGGTGGITMNGPGTLTLGANPSPNHSFSGGLVINSGMVRVGGTGTSNLGLGNLTLSGGVLSFYWTSTFTRTLGSGSGQVQITGGESGFSENGSTGGNVRFNNNTSYEVVWGSPFFNPSAFVLQAPDAQNSSTLKWQNKVDLNGTNRTVKVAQTTGTHAGYAQIEGVIRNSGATTAGIVKVGDGKLILTAANTYDGDTTVSNGVLQVNTTNANNDDANVIIESGATLTLNFTGTDTIYRLMINGEYQAAGEYGHTNSSATNGGLGVGALDAYFGAGNGKLNVIMGPPPPAGTVIVVK